MAVYPYLPAITNGNAEATSGWTSSVGTLAVGSFGGVYQGAGKFFSTGAPTAAGSVHEHYQDVALSASYNTDIDAGLVRAEFNAQLSRGGTDASRIKFEALTGVGGASLGLVTGAWWTGTAFTWHAEQLVFDPLPAGTRAVRCWLGMQNNDGGSSDGYQDAMSLGFYRNDQSLVAKIDTGILVGGRDDAGTVARVSAAALVGAYPDRLAASIVRGSVLHGARDDALSAAAIRVSVLVNTAMRRRRARVQIVG